MDLSNYLDKYQLKISKGPRHEQVGKVNEIEKVIGKIQDKEFGFWLRYVKKFSYGRILEICKLATNLPDKYNKTGFIVNKLKNGL